MRLKELPFIAMSEITPLHQQLLDIIEDDRGYIKELRNEIERLKQENAELKHQPIKPNIKPNCLEPKKPKKERSQLSSFANKQTLHEKRIIHLKPSSIPQGSTFKGIRTYTVQDLEIKKITFIYKRERWKTPEGKYILAPLPIDVQGWHFGPHIRQFILYQYHHCHVTQPVLLQQLKEFGVSISTAELNRILTNSLEVFEQESISLLETAVQNSAFLQVDDTGARHAGKNGVCIHLGNPWFSFFKTGESKSRSEFLKLINLEENYLVTKKSLDYVRHAGGSSLKLLKSLEKIRDKTLDKSGWEDFLKKENILKEEAKKVATEAALIGYFKAKYQVELKLMSDGARQYHLFDHLACWVHAVRLLEKEIPCHQKSREQVDEILKHICKLYHHLKSYQSNPRPVLANRIEKCFDWITKKRTLSSAFNSALERFLLMKEDLLKVLKYPWVPLHNNLSESALREYVKRRKISAGTRSEKGKQARDLYCSLKQTCRKLGVSFWQYLEDRLTKKNEILSLSKILEEALSAFCKCWPDLIAHGKP